MDVLDERAFKAGAAEADGILFNLMTIGEAAKNVPQEIRDIMPEIAWSDIGRFRDFVVHHYFSIDMDRVWRIVHTDLPELSQQVSALQKRLEEKSGGEP
ncbi:MAG: DUF86 domain-containing protein [Anaerolineae bacterium]|nr:DUF86 domain-containing protein [Anaerolineae bacterium]NUQ06329.1 DUF86 domain-containing protein [Anaerolineae bacterium]